MIREAMRPRAGPRGDSPHRRAFAVSVPAWRFNKSSGDPG
jgi:hypothetical protein